MNMNTWRQTRRVVYSTVFEILDETIWLIFDFQLKSISSIARGCMHDEWTQLSNRLLNNPNSRLNNIIELVFLLQLSHFSSLPLIQILFAKTYASLREWIRSHYINSHYNVFTCLCGFAYIIIRSHIPPRTHTHTFTQQFAFM